MKIKFLIIFVMGLSLILVPNAFASENLFVGTSVFERVPDKVIPGALYVFEMKFQYTDSPYWLHEISPIIEINPSVDAENIHVNFEEFGVNPRDIVRVPISLYVEPKVLSEKIFINISFTAKNSSGDELRSTWSESLILSIDSASIELPSSQDYEFATVHGASCTYDTSICHGVFSNGTTIPIQCDYRHSCGVIMSSPYKQFFSSPLKQIQSGIPIDEIQCREHLTFTYKHDGSPLCIKPESKSELIKRNWIKPVFSFCGADGFDSQGHLNKSNSTHQWNVNECSWHKIVGELNPEVLELGGERVRDYQSISEIFPEFLILNPWEDGRQNLQMTPHVIILNLTENNQVNIHNESGGPVNVYDNTNGQWQFLDVPSDYAVPLIINKTGNYEILVQNSLHGEMSEIVALSEETENLSARERARMAQTMLSFALDEFPEIVRIGSGSAFEGMTVGINSKFEHLGIEYYEKRIIDYIPFEVPMIVDFSEPATFAAANPE